MHLSRRATILGTIGAALAAKASTAALAAPATPYYSANTPPLPYKPYRVASSDGTQIAVQEWGNPHGPAIVFVHGVLQSHLSFEKQFRSDLAQHYRIITYDLRGHGDSAKPIGDQYYLDGGLWADDLASVMKVTDAHRPVLVGWSMGGVVLANYLKRYGDHAIAGLDFVDAMVKRSPKFAALPENHDLLPLCAAPDLSDRINAVRGFIRSCFATQPAQTDYERMVAFNAEVPRYVIKPILVGIPIDADEAFRKVNVPVLITHGAEDGQIGVKITQYGKSVMPAATVSIYAGCGHSPFYEMPERFNRELAQLVDKANI